MISRKLSRQFGTLLFIAATFLSLPASSSDSNVVRLYDVTANFPIPSWVDNAKEQLDKSEVSRTQKTTSLALEFIPKGQSFDSWTAMSAVYAWLLSEKDTDWFLEATFEIYEKACGEENTKIETIKDNPKQKLIVIYCEKLKIEIPEYGYIAGTGEIAVIQLENHAKTYVKNYHAWRGKAFKYSDKATWPITSDIIEKSVVSLSGAMLTPN